MKNLKWQISYILLPNYKNKPLVKRVAAAFLSIITVKNAERLFEEVDEKLIKIVFSEEELETSKEFLSSYFQSFMALYWRDGQRFVYYCLEGQVIKFLLTEDFYPKINVKVLVRRPL